MKIEETKDFIILRTKNDKVLKVIEKLINSESSDFNRMNLHRSIEVLGSIDEDLMPILVIIIHTEVFDEEYLFTRKKTKLESFLNQLLYYLKDRA